MTAKILPNPEFIGTYQGAVLAGGYVLTFAAGTSTQKDVYTEKTGTTAHNVTGAHAGESGFDLGTYGEAEVFWGEGQYKLVFYNSGDNVVNTIDDFDPQVQDTATPGNNLVLNGSFETDSDGDGDPDNWTLSNDTVAISTAQRKHGANSLKFTSTGSVASGTALTTAKIPVDARLDLEVLFEIYSVSLVESSRVRLKWYQADGSTFISNTDVLDAVAVTEDAWLEHRYPVTPPSNAGWVEFEIQGITNTLAGGEVYFDHLRLAEIPAYKDLPINHISGLNLSNGTDAAKDIDIAVGECRGSTDAANIVLSAILVKQIDAAWAVGTAAGGLDGTESVGGTPDADTWYHIWLIRRSDTGVVDALFSESATDPTMPTNYDQKRRIGAVLTDSTPDIIAFNSYETSGGGVDVEWDVPVQDFAVASAPTTAVLRAISTPLGLKIKADLIISIEDTSPANTVYLLVTSPDQTDTVASATVNTITDWDTGDGSVSGGAGGTAVQVRTDTSSQIRTRISAAGGASITTRCMTRGWEDSRLP